MTKYRICKFRELTKGWELIDKSQITEDHYELDTLKSNMEKSNTSIGIIKYVLVNNEDEPEYF